MPLIVGELVAQLGIEDNGYSDGMSAARAEATATSTQITAAENRIRTARSATNAAGTRLQAAEAQLAALRASGTASSAQLTAAEARVTAARQAHTTAIARNAQATAALRAQQAAATTSTNALAAAATRAKAALATVGVGVSMAAAVVAIQQSVMAASDLAESTNKVDQLFGQNAGKIKDWAAGAAQSLAMTNVEARDAASSMALYGQQANLTGDNLVNFSTQMTGLAADLASFSNTSPQEAVEALGAAFRGESDPIEQYGVLLNEDRLKQEALKAGLISTTSDALSPAIRVQAVYNSVLSQTTAQQGDFARTSDSFSNQLKIIRAETINAAASFGEKLIPVAQILADVAAGLIPIIGGVVSIIGGAASVFNSLPGPIQAAVAAIVAFRIASHFMGGAVTGAVGRVTGAFTGLARTTTVMTNQGRVQMGQFGSAVAGIGRHVPVVSRMQTAFLNAAQSANRFPRAAGAASAAMVGMRGAASGLMGALGGPWGLAIAGATAALGMWIAKKQKDKQASAEAASVTQNYADALRESGGVITKNMRETAMADERYKEARDSADALGVSQKELASAMLDGGHSAKKLLDQLDGIIRAGREVERNKDGVVTWKAYNDSAKAAIAMRDAINQSNKEMDDAKTAAMRTAEATGDVKVSFDGTTTAAGATSKAMTEFEESTDGAASKVDKLAKALNELRDDKLTQEDALQAWSDGIRSLASAWTEAGAAAVMANGHIDVTTEKGSALQDEIVDQAKVYDQVGAAALETAKSQQMSAGDTLSYVQSKVAPMRKAFIDQAVAAGVPLAQARRLADTYLGLPDDIVTKLSLKGADAAIDKLNGLHIKGAQPVQLKYSLLDNTKDVRDKLDYLKVKYSIIDGRVVINRDDVDKSKGAMDELGVKITDMPEGWIKITDTSAENLAHLHDLGIKTQTLPDGTIVINPDDAAFWTAVNKAQEPGEKKIIIKGQIDASSFSVGPISVVANVKADGGIDEYDSGGVRPSGVAPMPAQAVIEKGSGSGLVRWAEGETGWEAYIPGAASKRPRSMAILAETARRFGMGLHPIRAYADGAVTTPGLTTPVQQSMWNAVSAAYPSATMNSGTRYADVGSGFDNHMGGTAIDIGGSAADMMSIANWIADNYPDSEELIHGPGFARQIKKGKIVGDGGGDYGFYAGAGNHLDHVHWAMSHEVGAPGTAGATGTTGGVPTVPLIQNPDGTWTSPDPAWAALIKRESGGDPDIVQQVQDANSGGNEASGLFQIAKGTWKSNGGEKFAPTAGEATPHEQAEIAAAIFNKSGGSPWGAGLPGRENEDALRAGLTTTTSTGGDPGTTTSGAGDGQRVFVTNWPGSGYTGSTSTTGDKTSPTTTDTKRRKLFTIGGGRIYNGSPEAFAEGGTVGGTGWTDSELIAAMPGEEIIRKRVAERPGVRAFLKRLNAGQIDGFATGGTVGGFGSGFGGYKPETIGSVPQTPAGMLEQLYRLGVAGWGGAAMLGSAIGTDGSFQGLSTGSSTIPILDDIAKKLDEVIKEGRVGSIGIYVGDGGQIVVEDMGKLRDTQDKAANDAMLRSAAMRA